MGKPAKKEMENLGEVSSLTCLTCGSSLPSSAGVALQSACLKCGPAKMRKASKKKADEDGDEDESYEKK